MALTSSLSALQEFCRTLENPQSVWTTVSPSAAEERSRNYENRRRHWQKLIFSRIAVLHVIQHIQDSESAAAAADSEKADEEAAIALASLDETNNGGATEVSAESRAHLLATRAKLDECVALCKSVAERRKALIERANTVIQAATNANVGGVGENEWQGLSDLMHQQRETILSEIADKERRLKLLEDQEAKPLMVQVEECLVVLRQGKDERDRLRQENEQMKRVLADAHGIVADEEDEEVSSGDVSSFLAEELAVMSRYYDLAHKKASRIVSTEIERISADEYKLIIAPRSDWLKVVGAKGAQPRLKSIQVCYTRRSALPSSIALKVDLSDVPAERVEELRDALSRKIAAWKGRALQSPALDFQDIFHLFLVGLERRELD